MNINKKNENRKIFTFTKDNRIYPKHMEMDKT